MMAGTSAATLGKGGDSKEGKMRIAETVRW